MVICEKALPQDAEELTAICVRAFAQDLLEFGHIPPGSDSAEEHVRFMQGGEYYKITKNGALVGGFCLIPMGEAHMELGIIYVDPDYHGQGIGGAAMSFMDQAFPDVKVWTLDTGHGNVRNQYFYEKWGYQRVGESEPLADGYYKVLYRRER
ncbi:GNAT family N-acetyltransferase [Brevibacillus dissolubilis]|uniref:GNAT family N-acetyltransferase n=1 Tax=Brevibacillus dissolubilis TaxID=1844116 RepID=UPI001116FD8E|nr:GNAT family N-acetyltransferase [Brevibacillus dissolubilis]